MTVHNVDLITKVGSVVVPLDDEVADLLALFVGVLPSMEVEEAKVKIVGLIRTDPAPERAGREGDSQPLPERNEHPFVQDAVIADIEARKAVGIRRYGTALQPHNGRDALLDAYEEAIDLAIYLRQALMERDG